MARTGSSGVRCPICVTWYSKLLRKAGQKCGDHSQKQKRPCVGLVMDEADFHKAEWVRTVELTAPYVSPLKRATEIDPERKARELGYQDGKAGFRRRTWTEVFSGVGNDDPSLCQVYGKAYDEGMALPKV